MPQKKKKTFHAKGICVELFFFQLSYPQGFSNKSWSAFFLGTNLGQHFNPIKLLFPSSYMDRHMN